MSASTASPDAAVRVERFAARLARLAWAAMA